MGAFIDLSGKHFGKLLVKRRAGNRHNKVMWECICDCGKVTVAPSGDLSRGKTKSCGCNRIIHGGRNSRLYRIWSGMKTRCFNQVDHMYPVYGGRGITVCSEWRDNFKEFQKWALSAGYQDNLTLDRIDNDRAYSPENCRWVTVKEQENNRRDNRRISYNGKTQTLSQWSDETGLHRETIQWRLNHGWSVERALTKKVGGGSGKQF